MESRSTRSTSALLAIAIVQAVVGIVLLIGHRRGWGGSTSTSGNLDAIATLASAGVFACLYLWGDYLPRVAAIVGLAIYCTVLVIYVSQVRGSYSNIVRGDWGLWLGWLTVAILAILGGCVVNEFRASGP